MVPFQTTLSFNGKIIGSEPIDGGSIPSRVAILKRKEYIGIWMLKRQTRLPKHLLEHSPVLDTLDGPQPKVVFARRSAIAQRVEEVIKPPIRSIPNGSAPKVEGESSYLKSKIVHNYDDKGGRPRKDGKPTIRLPAGYQTLRAHGKVLYTEDVGNQFIEAYYESGGSLTRACRKAGVTFRAALQWKDTVPEFAMGLKEVDEIIKDEIHSQFMTRVLHEWEPNPSWKFKYFNKHFPEYSETKKSLKVSFQLKDTLIRPDIIEGEVIRRELEAENATRPEQPLDTPPNTG